MEKEKSVKSEKSEKQTSFKKSIRKNERNSISPTNTALVIIPKVSSQSLTLTPQKNSVSSSLKTISNLNAANKRKLNQSTKFAMKFVSRFYPQDWLNILSHSISPEKCLFILKTYFPIATYNAKSIVNLAHNMNVDNKLIGIEILPYRITDRVRFYFLQMIKYHYTEKLDDFIIYILRSYYCTTISKKLIPKILKVLLSRCSVSMVNKLKTFLKKSGNILNIEITDINLLYNHNIEIFRYVAYGMGNLSNGKVLCDKDVGYKKKIDAITFHSLIQNLEKMYKLEKDNIASYAKTKSLEKMYKLRKDIANNINKSRNNQSIVNDNNFPILLNFLFEYLTKNPELDKRVFYGNNDYLDVLIELTCQYGNEKQIDFLFTRVKFDKFKNCNSKNLLHIAKNYTLQLKDKFCNEDEMKLFLPLQLNLDELEELFSTLQMKFEISEFQLKKLYEKDQEDDISWNSEDYSFSSSNNSEILENIPMDKRELRKSSSGELYSDLEDDISTRNKLIINLDDDIADMEMTFSEVETDVDFDILMEESEMNVNKVSNIFNELDLQSKDKPKINIVNNIFNELDLQSKDVFYFILENDKNVNFSKKTIFDYLFPNTKDEQINNEMIKLTEEVIQKYFIVNDKFLEYFIYMLNNTEYKNSYTEYLYSRVTSHLNKTTKQDIDTLLVKFPESFTDEILQFFVFQDNNLLYIKYISLIKFLCSKSEYYNNVPIPNIKEKEHNKSSLNIRKKTVERSTSSTSGMEIKNVKKDNNTIDKSASMPIKSLSKKESLVKDNNAVKDSNNTIDKSASIPIKIPAKKESNNNSSTVDKSASIPIKFSNKKELPVKDNNTIDKSASMPIKFSPKKEPINNDTKKPIDRTTSASILQGIKFETKNSKKKKKKKAKEAKAKKEAKDKADKKKLNKPVVSYVNYTGQDNYVDHIGKEDVKDDKKKVVKVKKDSKRERRKKNDAMIDDILSQMTSVTDDFAKKEILLEDHLKKEPIKKDSLNKDINNNEIVKKDSLDKGAVNKEPLLVRKGSKSNSPSNSENNDEILPITRERSKSNSPSNSADNKDLHNIVSKEDSPSQLIKESRNSRDNEDDINLVIKKSSNKNIKTKEFIRNVSSDIPNEIIYYKDIIDEFLTNCYIKFFQDNHIKNFYVENKEVKTDSNENNKRLYPTNDFGIIYNINPGTNVSNYTKQNIDIYRKSQSHKILSVVMKYANFNLYNKFKTIINSDFQLKGEYVFHNKDINMMRFYIENLKLSDERREQVIKELEKYSDIITYQFKDQKIDAINILRNRMYKTVDNKIVRKVNYHIVRHLITNYDVQFEEYDVFNLLYIEKEKTNKSKLIDSKTNNSVPSKFNNTYIRKNSILNLKIDSLTKSDDELIKENFELFKLFITHHNKIIFTKDDKSSFSVLIKVAFRLRNTKYILHLMKTNSDEFRENVSGSYLYYICDINLIKELFNEGYYNIDDMFIYSYLGQMSSKVLHSDYYYKGAKQGDVILFLEYIFFTYCSDVYSNIVKIYLESLTNFEHDKVVDYLRLITV